MNRFCLLLMLCFTTFFLFAQKGPVTFSPQSLLFTGATIHTGDGKVISDGILAVKDKLIAYAGGKSELPSSMAGWTKVDVSGKHIYPGLIALNTQLGLTEIEAVDATNDYSEIGNYTPNVRALIAYNTDSKVIPTVRSNGILMAETTPQGGTVSGRSALVHLDAWNWEDAVIQDDAGIHINWPNLGGGRWARGNTNDKEAKERYKKQIDELSSYFDQAATYGGTTNADKNLMLEALNNCRQGTTRFFIHTDNASAIQDAVLFIKKHKLKGVLVGATGAASVADLLAKEKIPVVLMNTQRLPTSEDSPVDQGFSLPKKLKDAGVLYAIAVEGFWQTRNLGFQAGQSVPFGISKEDALASITLNPAKILGVDDKVGSLAAGKDATFIVSKGDIMDMRAAIVEYAYIQGRLVDLDNKQKELNERYMTKYSER